MDKKPKTKFIPADKLQLLENNPRYITEEDYDALKRSIELDADFFWVRPCLVNDASGELVIYAGNQRYRAAVELGWKEIPCVVETVTPEIQRRRVIIDNIQNGNFDYSMVAADYDIEELRDWGMKELDYVVEGEILADPLPEPKIEGDLCKKNKNWFYVEFYNDDEKYEKLLSIVELKGDSKHELTPDWFYRIIKECGKDEV